MSHRDGLALRSLVYHEILSAYLNYVKARGYTSMFIWACPPMAVSFLHVTIQKGLAALCMLLKSKGRHSNFAINIDREPSQSCNPMICSHMALIRLAKQFPSWRCLRALCVGLQERDGC